MEPLNPPLPPAHPADNPEWLCKSAGAMRKGFFVQPVHCQKAILAQGTSWQEMTSADTVYNTKRIGEVKTPIRAPLGAINLRPTLKPDGSVNASGSATAPASTPDDDGDTSSLISSGGEGKNYFMNVGVDTGNRGGPSLPSDFRGAEVSGQTQNPEFEPLPSNDKLRERLVERLDMNEGQCRKFFEKVFENLKLKNKSILSVFDEVVK